MLLNHPPLVFRLIRDLPWRPQQLCWISHVVSTLNTGRRKRRTCFIRTGFKQCKPAESSSLAMEEPRLILGCLLLSSPFPLSSCRRVQQLTEEILIPAPSSHTFPFPLWAFRTSPAPRRCHLASPRASLALPCSLDAAFSNFSLQAPAFATRFSHGLPPILLSE